MTPSPDYIRAAAGDHDAQSQMAQECAQLGIDGHLPTDTALVFAEVWARMAATSGRLDHRMCLAGLLLVRCALSESPDDAEARDTMSVEAIALIEAAADANCETAGIALVAIADAVGPEIFQRAKALHLEMETATWQ